MNRWLENRNVLGWLFMLPAGALLLVFLTYPLGLGTWLGFTDAKIGRPGEWIGAENFTFLFGDSSAVVYYLRAIGYRLAPVQQTGSKRRLAAKNRYNAATIGWYLLARWVYVFGLALLALLTIFPAIALWLPRLVSS